MDAVAGIEHHDLHGVRRASRPAAARTRGGKTERSSSASRSSVGTVKARKELEHRGCRCRARYEATMPRRHRQAPCPRRPGARPRASQPGFWSARSPTSPSESVTCSADLPLEVVEPRDIPGPVDRRRILDAPAGEPARGELRPARSTRPPRASGRRAGRRRRRGLDRSRTRRPGCCTVTVPSMADCGHGRAGRRPPRASPGAASAGPTRHHVRCQPVTPWTSTAIGASWAASLTGGRHS